MHKISNQTQKNTLKLFFYRRFLLFCHTSSKFYEISSHTRNYSWNTCKKIWKRNFWVNFFVSLKMMKTTKTESKARRRHRNWRCKKKRRIERAKEEREREVGEVRLKNVNAFSMMAIDVWKVQLDSRQKMWRDYWRLPRPHRAEQSNCSWAIERELFDEFFTSLESLVSWVTTLESLKNFLKKTFSGKFILRSFLGIKFVIYLIFDMNLFLSMHCCL